MSNSIVIQTNSTVIEDMKQQYKHSLSPKTPQGGIFMAKVPSCTITAYKSGKVMFQGGRAEAEAARWQTVPQTPKIAVKKSVDSHTVMHHLLPSVQCLSWGQMKWVLVISSDR